MQATEKIWMNGDLVDWDDARIHVGAHGLHYGTGVFEGVRCYDTPKGPRCVPPHGSHAAAARLGAADRHGDPLLGRRTAERDERPARRERPCGVLHPPDRVLRLRPARRLGSGQPGRDRDHVVAVGHLPRRGGARERNPDEDLDLAADPGERRPARLEGDGRVPELDACRERGAACGLRRSDPVDAGRQHRRRSRGDDLRRVAREDLHARSLHGDPARDHARLGDADRRRPRVRGGREEPDSHRPLPRRRGVHVRYSRRGNACGLGRRPARSGSGR